MYKRYRGTVKAVDIAPHRLFGHFLASSAASLSESRTKNKQNQVCISKRFLQLSFIIFLFFFFVGCVLMIESTSGKKKSEVYMRSTVGGFGGNSRHVEYSFRCFYCSSRVNCLQCLERKSRRVKACTMTAGETSEKNKPPSDENGHHFFRLSHLRTAVCSLRP